ITLGATSAIAGVPFSLDASHSADVGSVITAGNWNFADGSTGAGLSLTHTFTRSGTLPVSLSVTDASGATSSTTEDLVVTSARITHLRVKKGKKVEMLKATVNGPGKLMLGSKTVRAPRPGTFTIRDKLSKAQRTRLSNRESVTLKLKFVPTFGAA